MTSSWKEASLHVVYPTPPPPVKIQHPDLLLTPDPSILNISGFHIGLTASDIVMHLGKEELFWYIHIDFCFLANMSFL